MLRAIAFGWFFASLFLETGSCAEEFEIAEDDDQITVVTPELKAAIRKKGYVSGVAGESFVDRKTGAKDLGFGLDIADWIMEPGSDEEYRRKLDSELVWRPLFNGKDLAGWKPVGEGDNWIVLSGELQCTGKPGAHWIRTDQEYANFELRLEFKLGQNGNSGVFVRAPEAGSPWVEGLEIQLLDDFGPKWKDLQPDQFTASIYGVEAPSKRATKPAGQWQSMRIQCLNRHLQVWVNEEQVIDANLDSLLKKSEKVPGLKRQTGYIGFQDHGDATAFRKIEIRELR